MTRRGLGALALVLTIGACDLTLVDAPPSDPATVRFQVLDADPSLLDVLAKVNRARVELERGGVTIDTIVSVSVEGGSALARLIVAPPPGEGPLSVRTELRLHGQPLFSGAGTVGAERTAVVFLSPIPGSLDPAPLPDTVDALGDTLALSGMVRFATGDPLPGASPSWYSENPDVLEVEEGVRAIPRGNGATRLVMTYGDLELRLPVRVLQRPVELWSIAPVDTTVVAGAQFTMRAFGVDRTNAPLLPGVPLTWIAGGVVAVDSSGVVTALAAGNGFVRALLGDAQPTASVTVAPGG